MQEESRDALYRDHNKTYRIAYPDCDQLSVETSVSLLHTFDLLHQIMSRNLLEFGLSRSSLHILMLLKEGAPEGMLLHDLGELLLVSRANITGLIDHLEQKGYVRRVVDPQDRRARFAQLTKDGACLLDHFAPIYYRSINELLKDLSGKEKRMLISLLQKTRSSINAHVEAAGIEASHHSFKVAQG